MIYFCATPIGNLEDITLRVIRILGEVDIIYSEDTRRTINLLNHFDIKKPLKSCHEHNEAFRSKEIIELAQNGKNIAICSDAGMPAISDPGGVVLREAILANVEFTVLPGACAAITAFVLSGIDSRTFIFEGFLPRETTPRLEIFNKLVNQERAIIFYESPNRISQTLAELSQVLGNRNAAVCRELTKIHEECARGTLYELSQKYAEPPKGECVIIVQGADNQVNFEQDELIQAMQSLVDSGVKKKTAAKLIASQSKTSANILYNLFINK